MPKVLVLHSGGLDSTFSGDGLTPENSASDAHVAIDNLGNIGSPASYTWTVDLTYPVAAFTSQPPAISNSTAATFGFAGSDPVAGGVSSGINRLEYQIDGGNFTAGTGPVNLTNLSVGNHTLSLRAIDNAGNIGATTSYAWTIDLAAAATSKLEKAREAAQRR